MSPYREFYDGQPGLFLITFYLSFLTSHFHSTKEMENFAFVIFLSVYFCFVACFVLPLCWGHSSVEETLPESPTYLLFCLPQKISSKNSFAFCFTWFLVIPVLMSICYFGDHHVFFSSSFIPTRGFSYGKLLFSLTLKGKGKGKK